MKTLQQIQDDYYRELRDYAAAHPVPLPDSEQCLRDLAEIGVPGAFDKLAEQYEV